jgi:hypothetical protein
VAWAEQWSYKIDGTEINSGAFITDIPDLDSIGSVEAITVPIPNDYPVFIRTQPLDSTININTQMRPCSWAAFQTNLATLRGILTPGPHTLTAQVRGMAAAKSLTIIVTSTAVEAKGRRVSTQALVPRPVWA